MCFLSIAKHSYSYWYNAYTDINNPWHDIVYNKINSSNKSFFGRLWNLIVGGAKVIATPFVDAGGFICTPPDSFGYDQFGGSWAVYDLGKCLSNAGEASSSLWE